MKYSRFKSDTLMNSHVNTLPNKNKENQHVNEPFSKHNNAFSLIRKFHNEFLNKSIDSPYTIQNSKK